MRQTNSHGRSVVGGVCLVFLALAGGEIQHVYSDEKPPVVEHRSVISGKIVDQATMPVTGARTTLFQWKAPTGRWGRWKVLGEPVVADATGAYRFEGLPNARVLLQTEAPGFAKTFCQVVIQDQQPQQQNVVLQPPAAVVFRIKDQAGQPIVGARIRGFELGGVNGEVGFSPLALESLGIVVPASNQNGELTFSNLPSGNVIRALNIESAGFAPWQLEQLTVTDGAVVKATMRPGVTITLHMQNEPRQERITGAVVDLRHEQSSSPSNIVGYEAKFDSQGQAQLSIEPGNYSSLLLQNEKFFITPAYSSGRAKKQFLRFETGRNQNLHFDVHRKVTVRGRIIDAVTGKPLSGMSVFGELANRSLPGWSDPPLSKWSFASWGESNEQGEYQMDLAAGSARISFLGDDYLAERNHYEFQIAADGSASIPDIKVRPISKIVGQVQNPDGTAAARTIVRLKGDNGAATQPVLTDSTGRFEIQPKFVPINQDTNERAVAQTLIAFAPHSRLAAQADVRFDQSGEVVLKLETHEPDWPIWGFPAELSEWEQGTVSRELAATNSAISLLGRPIPEIDAALWLNTDGKSLQLSDLRGKYVLLDFWFTHCGPCHSDFPSVKLVHELYKDNGVVVIGVHNNSSDPESVREHVSKIDLKFPIAVDHPDGRTITRFEGHGVPDGYPNYVLISPAGKVLFDDRTIPAPKLRGYKLEMIRELLLKDQAQTK